MRPHEEYTYGIPISKHLSVAAKAENYFFVYTANTVISGTHGLKKNRRYKDKNASWIKTTKDKWEYEYKPHISCDTETSLVLEYSFAIAKEHDSTRFKDLVGSLKNSRYILLDSAYDSEGIYNMILERTSAIPVVGFCGCQPAKKLFQSLEQRQTQSLDKEVPDSQVLSYSDVSRVLL